MHIPGKAIVDIILCLSSDAGRNYVSVLYHFEIEQAFVESQQF